MSGKRNWGDNMTHRHDGKEPPPVVDEVRPVPSKLWKKKYNCKKLKDDHALEIHTIYRPRWYQEDSGTWINPSIPRHVAGYRMVGWDTYWVTWKCAACQKQVIEWQPPQKKFDKYRHTIWGVV